MLQDRPARHFSNVADTGVDFPMEEVGGVVLFSIDSGRPLPWPLGSSASELQRSAVTPCRPFRLNTALAGPSEDGHLAKVYACFPRVEGWFACCAAFVLHGFEGSAWARTCGWAGRSSVQPKAALWVDCGWYVVLLMRCLAGLYHVMMSRRGRKQGEGSFGYAEPHLLEESMDGWKEESRDDIRILNVKT